MFAGFTDLGTGERNRAIPMTSGLRLRFRLKSDLLDLLDLHDPAVVNHNLDLSEPQGFDLGTHLAQPDRGIRFAARVADVVY